MVVVVVLLLLLLFFMLLFCSLLRRALVVHTSNHNAAHHIERPAAPQRRPTRHRRLNQSARSGIQRRSGLIGTAWYRAVVVVLAVAAERARVADGVQRYF